MRRQVRGMGQWEGFFDGVTLSGFENVQFPLTPNLPSPCLPMLFCEMQLEKVIMRIFAFYLIQKDHTLKLCARTR
jgi:hypothetical protein